MNNIFTIFDYETRSEADLKKVGGFEYAKHPSTEIICAAWRTGTRDELRAQLENSKRWLKENPSLSVFLNPYAPNYWFGLDLDILTKFTRNKNALIKALRAPNILVAHNAAFEQWITEHVLYRDLETEIVRPPQDWRCTASYAAALALPRNLEGACAALSLNVQKDMIGRRLILKYCKPRKASKNNSAKYFEEKRDFVRILKYCGTDVDAETELFLKVPPLNPIEKKVWSLDQKINQKGVNVDRSTVLKTLDMISEETKILKHEAVELSNGELESPNQRDAVMRWLKSKGVVLPNLQAKTIADFLLTAVKNEDARRLLEIRQAISKTSTAKYVALEMRSRTDGRLRDTLLYHAASTGRWGGMGFQPQNLPRGVKGVSPIHATEYLKDGDLKLIKLLYGDPMGVFSTCIRSMLIPSAGAKFYCADFNAIEVRVLFWLAKHTEGLRAFHENRDLYVEIAVPIYRLKSEKQVNDAQRDLGKRAILGCGYGMGKKKFFETCKQWGQGVSEELAESAVLTYRELHAPVVQLWRNYERAAISATCARGKVFKINRTKWFVKDNFLFCELPSGRRLAYYGPEIRYEKTPWGEPMPKLYHWGVNSMSKKWECAATYGGKLTENVTQAVARDLMAEAMLRIDKAGFEIVLSVHDELLAESFKTRELSEFEKLMAELPAWADGCPVKAKGWTGERYRK